MRDGSLVDPLSNEQWQKKIKTQKLAPIHPGHLLREELEEVGVSVNKLGRDLRVPVNRISEIVNGKRSITADTALRLARYFGTSAQLWLNLQTRYDLEVAEAQKLQEIERDVRPMVAPSLHQELL